MGNHRGQIDGRGDGGVPAGNSVRWGIGLAPGWRPHAAGLALGGLIIALGTTTFAAMGLLLGGTLRAEIVLAIANLLWFVFAGLAADRRYGRGARCRDLEFRLTPSGALSEALTQAMSPSVDWFGVVGAGGVGCSLRGGRIALVPLQLSPPGPTTVCSSPSSTIGRCPSDGLSCGLWTCYRSPVRGAARHSLHLRGHPHPGWNRRHRCDCACHRIRPRCSPGRCFPGTTYRFPAEVPESRQAVEFGNRLISIAVVITAILAVLAALTQAMTSRKFLVYAWLMHASTVVQTVIGGITTAPACCGGRLRCTCWFRWPRVAARHAAFVKVGRARCRRSARTDAQTIAAVGGPLRLDLTG